MPANILLIDDHDQTRDIIQVVLNQHGYRTRAANSGEGGILLAKEQAPDLILLDANMPPGIDGFETCRRLRAEPPLQKIPIIMFTANDQPTDKIAGFEAGVDDFLIKPTTPKELLQRVSILLERAASGLLEPHVPAPSPAQDPATLVDEPEPEPAHSPLVHMAAPGELPTGSKVLGRVVSVMGARGGAGATTLAINLAYSLADQGQRVTLADLDILQGHIASYLQQPTHSGVHNLSGHERMALIRQIKQELVPGGDRLELLLTRANLDGRFPVLKPSQITNVVSTLRRYSDCAVIDVGRGLSSTSQLVLSQTDRLLICSRPERVSLTATRQLIRHVRALEFTGLIDVVLIQFDPPQTLPREAIEHFLKQSLLGVITIDPALLSHAVNNGQPLWQLSDASGAFATALRQLGHELAPVS